MQVALDLAVVIRSLSAAIADHAQRQLAANLKFCQMLTEAADQLENIAGRAADEPGTNGLYSPELVLLADRLLPLIPKGKKVSTLLADLGYQEVVHLLFLTAEAFNCSVGDILGPSRFQKVVPARQCAIWLINRVTSVTPWRQAELARLFDRNNSTIIYSIRRVDERLETDQDLATQLDRIAKEARTLAQQAVQSNQSRLHHTAWAGQYRSVQAVEGPHLSDLIYCAYASGILRLTQEVVH